MQAPTLHSCHRAGGPQRPRTARLLQSSASQQQQYPARPGQQPPCLQPACMTAPSRRHPGSAPGLWRPHAQAFSARALPDVLPLVVESPFRDAVCFTISVIGAVALVKVFDALATNGVIDQKLSRKLVHTASGPLFVLTWPLFSANPTAKLLAACVPLLNFARLMLVGTGVVEDRGLVLSVSRSGERGELLKGPLYYCVVLICVALLCWRDSPAGLIAISLMCGGDGLADIIGRRFGSVKLPYNNAKSWAGSTAMFFGGVAMSLGLIYCFCNLGFFPCYGPACMLPYVLAISLAATVAESLPVNQVLDDNISVPLVSLGLSSLLMEYLKSCPPV